MKIDNNWKFTYLQVINFLIISLVGILYIPFITLMPNDWFRDRDNYLIYANMASIIKDKYEGISLYFNEPIFLLINDKLSLYFDVEIIPHIFSFFLVFSFFVGLAYYSKNILMFFLGLILSILIPYMLQSELVVLRQGLATSIFIISFLLVKNDKIIAAVLFFLAFIHSIFFIFFIFFILNFIFFSKIDFKVKLSLNFILMATVSIFSILLAQFFGLRQGDEYQQNMEVSRGGGAFLLFFFLAIYLYLFGEKKNKKLYEFSLIGLVMFLTAYFLTPISGRLFNTIIPFILFLLTSRAKLQDYLIVFIVLIVFLFLFLNGSYNDLLVIHELEAKEEFLEYCRDFFSL